MTKVFISHSSSDKDFAIKLAHELKSHNINVWLDKDKIKVGDSIVKKISEGLEETEYLILILSKKSIQSKWVESEWVAKYWDEIENEKVSLLPVLLEDCEIPQLLKGKKYADFRNNFKNGILELLEVITGEKHPKELNTQNIEKASLFPLKVDLNIKSGGLQSRASEPVLYKYQIGFQIHNISDKAILDYSLEIWIPKNSLNAINNPIFKLPYRDESDHYVFSIPGQSTIFQNQKIQIAEVKMNIDSKVYKELKEKGIVVNIFIEKGSHSEVINIVENLTYNGLEIDPEKMIRR